VASRRDPASVLWRGGVHYLVPCARPASERPPSEAEVAAAFVDLAASGAGRQAEAIVAALLWRPDWGGALAAALAGCTQPAAQRELRFAYVTACYLQRYWQPLLELYGFAAALPDLYTRELGLPAVSAEAFACKWNLHVLAQRRQQETGTNFAAEYDRIMHHLERQWVAEGRLPAPAGSRP
jgi:hypothetical protein